VRKDSGDREAARTLHVHEVAVGSCNQALHLVALLLKVFRWGQKIVRDWHLDEKVFGREVNRKRTREKATKKSVKINKESSHKHALEALLERKADLQRRNKRKGSFCEFFGGVSVLLVSKKHKQKSETILV